MYLLLSYIGCYDSSSRTNVVFVTSAHTICNSSVNIFYGNLFVWCDVRGLPIVRNRCFVPFHIIACASVVTDGLCLNFSIITPFICYTCLLYYLRGLKWFSTYIPMGIKRNELRVCLCLKRKLFVCARYYIAVYDMKSVRRHLI